MQNLKKQIASVYKTYIKFKKRTSPLLIVYIMILGSKNILTPADATDCYL